MDEARLQAVIDHVALPETAARWHQELAGLPPPRALTANLVTQLIAAQEEVQVGVVPPAGGRHAGRLPGQRGHRTATPVTRSRRPPCGPSTRAAASSGKRWRATASISTSRTTPGASGCASGTPPRWICWPTPAGCWSGWRCCASCCSAIRPCRPRTLSRDRRASRPWIAPPWRSSTSSRGPSSTTTPSSTSSPPALIEQGAAPSPTRRPGPGLGGCAASPDQPLQRSPGIAAPMSVG